MLTWSCDDPSDIAPWKGPEIALGDTVSFTRRPTLRTPEAAFSTLVQCHLSARRRRVSGAELSNMTRMSSRPISLG